jgi:hypothetical protein
MPRVAPTLAASYLPHRPCRTLPFQDFRTLLGPWYVLCLFILRFTDLPLLAKARAHRPPSRLRPSRPIPRCISPSHWPHMPCRPAPMFRRFVSRLGSSTIRASSPHLTFRLVLPPPPSASLLRSYLRFLMYSNACIVLNTLFLACFTSLTVNPRECSDLRGGIRDRRRVGL